MTTQTTTLQQPRANHLSGRGWSRLLALLILAICFTPRIRLGAVGGKAADIRLQDLLLPVLLTLVVMGVGAYPRMRDTWGPWALIYALGATVTTLLVLFFDPTQPLARTLVYLGRNLEILVLATLVATLYVRSRQYGRRAALRALQLAAWGNGAWVLLQAATGQRRVLIGSDVGDEIASYGPKLIGEASSFGTGFFFAMVAALGAAQYRSRAGRLHGLALVAMGLVGTFLAQSRLSMLAAGLVAVLLTLSPRPGSKNALGATFVAGLGVIGYMLLPPTLEGRLSAEGVEMGLSQRVDQIWSPLVSIAVGRPFTGIGPGSLGTTEYPWTEAHNIFLRAALDYGLLVAVAFALMLITILRQTRRSAADETDREVCLFGSFAFATVLSLVVTGLLQESTAAVMPSHLAMLAVGLAAGSSWVSSQRASG